MQWRSDGHCQNAVGPKCQRGVNAKLPQIAVVGGKKRATLQPDTPQAARFGRKLGYQFGVITGRLDDELLGFWVEDGGNGRYAIYNAMRGPAKVLHHVV